MKEFDEIYKIVKVIQSSRVRSLNDEEKKQLNDWLGEDENNINLYESLVNDSNIPKKIKELANFDEVAGYSRFAETRLKTTRKIVRRVLQYAAVILPIAFAVYFLFLNEKHLQNGIELVDSNIHPGSSKAILKLADGTTINLENETKSISETDGTLIQTNSKKVVYSADNKKVKSRNIKYNVIEIPKGGEYQLTLSDGTEVWLNSETIIKYPVVFSQDKREVFVQGEAFFDVVHDENTPFVVITDKIDINVLGTTFNVRTYAGEKITTTTLVKGEVSITQNDNHKEFLLKPNEQAVISEKESMIKTVNVNQFVAWKDGRILFEENTLEEIFNDLSRWYDIQVDYESEDLKDLRFSVDVKRYDRFSEILEIIRLTKKVKFKIDENKITVLNN
jgi:ferric-dicitrate binding protein FerR (iron transport regulator)